MGAVNSKDTARFEEHDFGMRAKGDPKAVTKFAGLPNINGAGVSSSHRQTRLHIRHAANFGGE